MTNLVLFPLIISSIVLTQCFLKMLILFPLYCSCYNNTVGRMVILTFPLFCSLLPNVFAILWKDELKDACDPNFLFTCKCLKIDSLVLDMINTFKTWAISYMFTDRVLSNLNVCLLTESRYLASFLCLKINTLIFYNFRAIYVNHQCTNTWHFYITNTVSEKLFWRKKHKKR